MRSKFIGGILLIVGTSIGGGMLALPLANAATGFWQSTVFLVLCWLIMTLGALFILEVNLYLPSGKNMVSMAAATLGKPGMLIAWLSYLFLLYTLLSAYISGGADVLGGLLHYIHLTAPAWVLATLFTLILGTVVYGGIRQVDLLNRGLMFGKLAIYLILVLVLAPYVKVSTLSNGELQAMTTAIMLLMTSFGFAIIVPNLREYFDDDIPLLKKVILIGSLIPLLCYIAWDFVIMGALPKTGLVTLRYSDHATSSLALLLSQTIHNTFINTFFNSFTSICMLTAFLGVSLCLLSFLGDGLKMEQRGKEGLFLLALTFLPPLLIVIYFPGAYLYALNYAGFFCVILLLLLPALMSWMGRKYFSTPFIVPGGRWSQALVIICAVGLLFIAK